jgi:hypothetical protein
MAQMVDIYGRKVNFQAMWVVLTHNDDSIGGNGAWNFIDSYYDLTDAHTREQIIKAENPDTITAIVRFVDIAPHTMCSCFLCNPEGR